MKTMLAVVLLMGLSAVAQTSSLTVHEENGKSTTITCTGGQAADCYSRDSTLDGFDKREYKYCRSIGMKGSDIWTKTKVDGPNPISGIGKTHTEYSISTQCDDAVTKQLLAGGHLDKK
jgi:hypothetical protein